MLHCMYDKKNNTSQSHNPIHELREQSYDSTAHAWHVTKSSHSHLCTKRRRYSNTCMVLAAQCLEQSPRALAGAPIIRKLPSNDFSGKHCGGRVSPNLPVLDVTQVHLRRKLHNPKHKKKPPRLIITTLDLIGFSNAPHRGIPLHLPRRRRHHRRLPVKLSIVQ